MTRGADAETFTSAMARMARRMTWLAVAEGASVGFAIAAVAGLARRAGGRDAWGVVVAGVVLAAAGALVAWVRRSRGATLRDAAARVEQRAPACRNVVITAAELTDAHGRISARVEALVQQQASRVLSALDPALLFPARRAALTLGASGALWAIVAMRVGIHAPAGNGGPVEAVTTATVSSIDVTVTPPAYAHRPLVTLHDPARIEALVGSRVRLTVHGTAGTMLAETIGAKTTLDRTSAQTFTGEIIADADGFIAVEPAASDGRAGARRLMGLSVTPDRPPRVHVTAPARDLFIPDAHRTLDVAIEADDDIGLQSLRLRYTRVSGAGEQFTFTDGEVPVAITRTNDRSWSAHAVWVLDSLHLTRGDVVVYRGVAEDARPGATPSESDSFIIEITAPGDVAADGFAIDDQRDRYALSEQMVILHTERLLARRGAAAADSVRAESMIIAAEQRQVRAEFVFMMGGELADEVVTAADLLQLHEEGEANAEEDLAAGRMANQGRLALTRAIRSMSLASTSLTTATLDTALTHERAALASLQTAFSHTRYILRALTQREQLDLSRRMTGPLAGVGRDAGPRVQPLPNARIADLRLVLADIAGLGAGAEFSADAAGRAALDAQHALQAGPSDTTLQRAARFVSGAGEAIAASRAADARALIDSAAMALSAAIRAGEPRAPRSAVALDAAQLHGALGDALARATHAGRGTTTAGARR